MKVLHFNASLKGGAAIGAQRIFDSILPYGPEMHFYSATPINRANFHVYNPGGAGGTLQQLLNRIKLSLYYRNLSVITTGKLKEFEKFTPAQMPFVSPMPMDSGMPDIIHLHWTSEMIDFPSFFKSIPNNIPIVWTCHDMNPFTGGCHYAWGCEKFKQQCQACPQIVGSSTKDESTKAQTTKIKALHGKQLHIVGNSHWMAGEASKSTVFSHAKSFQAIHCPVDVEAFFPLNKSEAKRILGIADDAKVISFGAAVFDTKRKGFSILIDALKEVYANEPKLECLVFGAALLQPHEAGNLPLRYMGYVESALLQRIVYSAADVFVIPSLQEAFGQTALEAMACGTAVVGFDTGGIPDMIKHGETGLLAENGNKEALTQAITTLLEDEALRNAMAVKAHQFATENFNYARIGKQYFDVYTNALANR